MFWDEAFKELGRLRQMGCTLEAAQKMLSVVVHYPYSAAAILTLLCRGHVSGLWSVVKHDAKPQASLFRNCRRYLNLLKIKGRNTTHLP